MVCDGQGAGKIIQIGGGEHFSVNINYMGLILGRTLKGSIFGGLKGKSDLPIIYEKCRNGVSVSYRPIN